MERHADRGRISQPQSSERCRMVDMTTNHNHFQPLHIVGFLIGMPFTLAALLGVRLPAGARLVPELKVFAYARFY